MIQPFTVGMILLISNMQDGDTALLVASSYGEVAMVQYLLSKQADISIMNNEV